MTNHPKPCLACREGLVGAHPMDRPFSYSYGFCKSCGVRLDYANPTCLYPARHKGSPQE